METLEGLQSQQKSVYQDLQNVLNKTHREQAREYLRFQLQLVTSLKARSVSNHERLKNEIELVIFSPGPLIPFLQSAENSSNTGLYCARPPG